MVENEAFARKQRIDPDLLRAGWDISDKNVVGLEIPVDGYDAEPWNGITDYCLYQPTGEVIAVVVAKRQSRNPNVAREQARHYVTEIGKKQSFQPFVFLTNGVHTYFAAWTARPSGTPAAMTLFEHRAEDRVRVPGERTAYPAAVGAATVSR